MSSENINYDQLSVRVPAVPAPELIGTWWRRRWHFTLSAGEWNNPRLPPPIGEMRDIAIVVTAFASSKTELIVETYTTAEMMSGDEMTYLSVVSVWLTRNYGPHNVVIEGMSLHPLLSMSRLPEDVVADLEEKGY